MPPVEATILKIFLPLSGMASTLIFCWRLKRRKFFYLRLLAYIALYVAVDYVSSLLVSLNADVWLHCFYNIVTFFVLSVILLVVFDEKFLTVLFCTISGKCTMHVAEYLTKIIFNYTLKNTYLSILYYIIVFVVIYFLFARKIRSEECEYLNNVKLVVFALVVHLGTDVILLVYNGRGMDEKVNVLVFALLTIICIVVLFLQFFLLSESRQKRESMMMDSIREKEREQYEISKEKINLIGIRQHDLKNILASRTDLHMSELNEIVQSIDSFDLPYRTGNRTLDMVLLEKNSTCKSLNIRLECLADGASLGFMSELEIYSLFLNALNNSVEAVKKIEEPKKRVIWIKIYRRGDLLFIQVRNYYAEISRNANGFATTKQDKNNHGYGLKSMKMITEKYGGEMSAKTDGDMFCLGIVIPVPHSDSDKSEP